MKKLVLLFLGLLATQLAFSQVADPYPSKTIKVVVPWPAGGSTDNMARIAAQRLTVILKQPVIVENRPGATGTLGTLGVIQSPPDGYTLVFMAASLHTFSPHLLKSMPFDAVADLTPISNSVQLPYVLLVSAEGPYKTAGELIKAAKAEPGKLSYGSFGVGSGPHIATELLRLNAGFEALHVPYKGGSQALAGLMGGQIPFMFDSLPSAIGQIRSGRVRPLAVMSPQRSPVLPEVPTLMEQGFNIQGVIWNGLGGPPNLPQPIVAKLFDAMTRLAVDPEFVKKVADMGAEAISSKSPAEFREFMVKERDRWGKVIREAKIPASD